MCVQSRQLSLGSWYPPPRTPLQHVLDSRVKEPDGEFLANVLAQLWADSAEPTKAWKSPAAKEAVAPGTEIRGWRFQGSHGREGLL